ncbi:MAG: hypothetical protein U0237_19645 [Thermoleophilia bacterium]
MTSKAPLTALVRAQMNRHAADDLAAALTTSGWRGAGTRVPVDGPPEVTFPLSGMHVGLRRLVSSLPAVLDTWRRHHGLDGYELMVMRGEDRAVHHVAAGDPEHDALRALVAGITEVLSGDGAPAGTV